MANGFEASIIENFSIGIFRFRRSVSGEDACDCLNSPAKTFLEKSDDIDTLEPTISRNIIKNYLTELADSFLSGEVRNERRVIRCEKSKAALEIETRSWRGADCALIIEGIIRDVTVEQADLDKLMHEKQILDTVLANIPHSVFWKDENSVYLGCNERFLRDAGLQLRADVIGKSDFEMPWGATDAESYRKYDLDLMSSATSVLNLEETQTQADGAQKFLVTSKVPLCDSSGKIFGILGIYMDITEHRIVQQKLIEQQEKIHGVSKMAALGEMAAGIAHEIKNPMAVISALASEILFELDATEQNFALVRSNLESIETTLDRVDGIIRGLSAVSRNGAQDPVISVPLQAMFAQVHALCSDRFRKNGIDIYCAPVPENIRIRGRPTELLQVMMNLLNNAFDAIETSTEIRWVRIENTIASDEVSIRVTDSGHGIPPSIREKMLQPFFTTKPVGEGTGLGLSICAGLIKAIGGRFEYVADSPNTQFLVALPRAA